MEDFKDKTEQWNNKYEAALVNCTQENYAELLKEVLKDMVDFDNNNDIPPLEKIIMLVNECIIIDAMEDNQIEYENKEISRGNILEQIKVFYEEFGADNLVETFCTDLLKAFKEKLTYWIALLLYKVHDYREALRYFHESREQSKCLNDFIDSNGLNLKSRIQRDIHYAYCCEYIGTPEENIEKVSKAIQILLGAKKDVSAIEYWTGLKNHCYSNLEKIESILISRAERLEKAKKLILILVSFSPDQYCVFSRLKNCTDGVCADEYIEAIHVLAHCLNEINLFGNAFIRANADEIPKQTKTEAIVELKQKNLIKLVSKFLIDAIGDKYITCQATIRAEQGNGVDAIKKMRDINTEEFSDRDKAELNFYQYYFESLFFADSRNNIHSYGEDFLHYCESHSDEDRVACEDGRLHYQVVRLRNELRRFIKTIAESDERDRAFLDGTNKISSSGCFSPYEELRKRKFSDYVNSQIVMEQERLILVYKILRMLQNLKLPLFFDDGADFSEQLTVTDDIEDVFELCRKINSYTQRNVSKACSARRCHFCETREENQCNQQLDSLLNTDESEDYNTIKIDGMVFDIYGDYKSLKHFLDDKYLLKYTFLTQQESLKNCMYSRYKILIFEGDDWYSCCSDLGEEINAGAKYHVFYVGCPDFENFNSSPILALPKLDICFLMAYIYSTLEQIVTETFNPKPIYILAPLRNATNYQFQEAEFKSFLLYPIKKTQTLKFEQGGIGIHLNSNFTESDIFSVKFINREVANACITIVKFHEYKLYVRRDNELVRKMVHSGLVMDMYQEYSNARKNSQDKRHSAKCNTIKGSRCKYFFSAINDKPGSDTLTIKQKQAGTKLLRFLRISCEEDDICEPDMYVLESAYLEHDKKEGSDFELCIFRENISAYVPAGCCYREVVQIEKKCSCSGAEENNPDSVPPANASILEESIQIRNELEQLQERIKKAQEYLKEGSHTDDIKSIIGKMSRETNKLLENLNDKDADLKKIGLQYQELKQKLNKNVGDWFS